MPVISCSGDRSSDSGPALGHRCERNGVSRAVCTDGLQCADKLSRWGAGGRAVQASHARAALVRILFFVLRHRSFGAKPLCGSFASSRRQSRYVGSLVSQLGFGRSCGFSGGRRCNVVLTRWSDIAGWVRVVSAAAALSTVTRVIVIAKCAVGRDEYALYDRFLPSVVGAKRDPRRVTPRQEPDKWMPSRVSAHVC